MDKSVYEKLYDVIIIGAGPSGLTAGIYCGRYKLDTLIVEKAAVGGQITSTSEIENYPGGMLEEAESGITLTERMRKQAEHFGAGFLSAEIAEIRLNDKVPENEGAAIFRKNPDQVLEKTYHAGIGRQKADSKNESSVGSGNAEADIKKLRLTDGNELRCRALIIAGGAHFKPIGCRNEERFAGCGISYCATCDANFFADLDVYVVGGGESAVEEAVFLSRIARHVTVIHRRDRLKASRYTQERAFAEPKISFIWNSIVEEAIGEEVLEGIRLKNVLTGEETVIMADEEDGMMGLFGFVGMQPETGIYASAGIRLEDGYIAAGEDTHTDIPGVFAAGDIRTKSLRQVVTACADGAVAASEAEKYLSLG